MSLAKNIFASFTNSFVPHFCPSGTNDFQSRNSSLIKNYKRGTLLALVYQKCDRNFKKNG